MENAFLRIILLRKYEQVLTNVIKSIIMFTMYPYTHKRSNKFNYRRKEMKKVLSAILATALILCLVPAMLVSAANDVTVYLATSGNDSNAGTEAAPIKTFAKAAALAEGKDSITVIVLDEQKVEPADFPAFPCPVTVKGKDGSKVKVSFNAISISGKVTFDNMSIANHTAAQAFLLKDGGELVVGANCETIKGSNYPAMLSSGNIFCKVTTYSGYWFYIYTCGIIELLGTTTAQNVTCTYSIPDGAVVPYTHTLVDTEGVINWVAAAGTPAAGDVANGTVTVKNGTVGRVFLGAYPSTGGGKAGPDNAKVEVGNVALNIYGGKINEIFYHGLQYAYESPDDSSIPNFFGAPKNITINLFGDAAKTIYDEAAKTSQYDPAAPVTVNNKAATDAYEILGEKVEEEDKEDGKTEDKEDDKTEDKEDDKTEDKEQSPTTSDNMVAFAILGTVALAGVAFASKKR